MASPSKQDVQAAIGQYIDGLEVPLRALNQEVLALNLPIGF